jgi:hypothetical protein
MSGADDPRSCGGDSFTGDLSVSESLETARVVWRALDELPDLDATLRAINALDVEDLRCLVLVRWLLDRKDEVDRG